MAKKKSKKSVKSAIKDVDDAVKFANNHISLKRVLCFILICGIFCTTLIWSDFFEGLINKKSTSVSSGEGAVVLSSDDLKLHFINVEHGDAILIELPDDKIMLIDQANEGQSATNLLNYLSSKIFNTRSDKTIDYFVLTHSHLDHHGASKRVLEAYDCTNIYRPKKLAEDEKSLYYANDDTYTVKEGVKYNSVVNAMYAEVEEIGADMYFNEVGIVIESGEVEASSFGYKISWLGPYENQYAEENAYSPIMLLEYKDSKIILTGDAEVENENEILDNISDKTILECDILKLGHHGSKTSSSELFLRTTKPDYVVICGKEGEYSDLPASVVLERLKSLGITDDRVLRTDKQGNIVVGINDVTGELAIITDNEAATFYLHWYYIVILACVVVAVIIFGTKIKKKKKTNKD